MKVWLYGSFAEAVKLIIKKKKKFCCFIHADCGWLFVILGALNKNRHRINCKNELIVLCLPWYLTNLCVALARTVPVALTMSVPIPGKYQHYKNENIDEYFSVIGVPFMGRKMMAMSSPLMEITLDGETMTIKTASLMRTVEYTFKLGEEYEEQMPNTIIKSVTNLVNDHELETISVIQENGAKSGRHYLFTEDECVITLTHEKAKVPGKRYFRRVN